MIEKALRPLMKHKKIYYGAVEVLGRLLRFRGRSGVDVAEEDWDNLVVLDACRYDTFEDLNTFEGELYERRSKATATPQWLVRNFDRDMSDTVYVTGNPYVSKLAMDGFYDAEEAFCHVEKVYENGWEDSKGVPPEPIIESARELKEEYPDKRFILHFMQPHEPFIGDYDFDVEGDGWRGRYLKWTDSRVGKAYRENLKFVLDEIGPLVDELEGETVITSDHGEILDNKYGFIAHPKDIFIEDLYRVPWFRVSGE